MVCDSEIWGEIVVKTKEKQNLKLMNITFLLLTNETF